jgi:hypothetical protein
VAQVCIWTPDKDLAQCVRGDRVVQVLRKAKVILDAGAGRAKFGVDPERIPDLLALVGDAAMAIPASRASGESGQPGSSNSTVPIESFPPAVLGEEDRERALLFKDLATLRSDARLFTTWRSCAGAGLPKHFPRWRRNRRRATARPVPARRTMRFLLLPGGHLPLDPAPCQPDGHSVDSIRFQRLRGLHP